MSLPAGEWPGADAWAEVRDYPGPIPPGLSFGDDVLDPDGTVGVVELARELDHELRRIHGEIKAISESGAKRNAAAHPEDPFAALDYGEGRTAEDEARIAGLRAAHDARLRAFAAEQAGA